MGFKGLRNGAIVAFILSMVALLVGGYFAMEKVPPIPDKVVSGENLLTDLKPSYTVKTFTNVTG